MTAVRLPLVDLRAQYESITSDIDAAHRPRASRRRHRRSAIESASGCSRRASTPASTIRFRCTSSRPGSPPATERIAAGILSLPIYPELPPAVIDAVAAAV